MAGGPPRHPRVAVVSEADEIDLCREERGDGPADPGAACWRVELWGIVRHPSGGEEGRALEARPYSGRAAEVAQVAESLLPRLRPPPAPPPAPE